MKITDIECIHVAIPKVSSNIIGGSNAYEGNPYREETTEHMNQFVDTVPHFGHSVSCIVKVYTDEGIVGYGEAGNDKRCDIERIKQNLIGMDVFDLSYLSNFTMQGRGNTLRNFAKNIDLPRTKEMSAIEFALWDIIGKKLNQPVYKLLGGKVREKVPITLFLGERPIDECIADIDRAMKQGIKTVKLKVGCNDKRDVELFQEVRRQFGYDLAVRIDPNAAWTVPEAIRMLKRMEKYNPQYVEGALKKTENYGFRRIREATGVPVCICEQFNGYIEMTTEALRGGAAARGYDARWQKARKAFLSRHPLCAECLKNGVLTPATVVDHIIPHRGDRSLFWDENNWQPLCKGCHDRKTGSGL